MTSSKSTNVMLVGVGGQGTLLAADVVALVGMASGYDAKKSEVHGMAQRGGSVTSHVRWAERVYSPLIAPGQVDYFMAFERLEALRYAEMLAPHGVLLVNDYRISPVSVSSGNDVYPSDEDERRAYRTIADRVHLVRAMEIAKGLGNARVNNVVMLGVLSAFMDLDADVWLDVIAQRVPQRFIELNREAFAAGRRSILAKGEA